jgi:hypothetical protein
MGRAESMGGILRRREYGRNSEKYETSIALCAAPRPGQTEMIPVRIAYWTSSAVVWSPSTCMTPGPVELGSPCRDVQNLRDLLGRPALGDELQDLALTERQTPIRIGPLR